jgi:hypothetical protein
VKEVQGRCDRLIVIADEQADDSVPVPTATGQRRHLQERCWLREVDAHRRLERSRDRLHPRVRIVRVGELN